MDDLADACDDFCIENAVIGEKFITENWEWMDVTIRCYYLCQVISECLDDLSGELDDEEA